MFELELGDVLDEMEAEGAVAGAEWEKGQYPLEIIRTSVTATAAGKPRLGFLWKQLEGPFAGEAEWENINYDVENKISKEIFVNKMLSLGISKEFLRSKPTMEQLADMVIGVKAIVDYFTKPWKSDASKLEKKFKVVRLLQDSLEDEDVEEDVSEEETSETDDDVFGGVGD